MKLKKYLGVICMAGLIATVSGCSTDEKVDKEDVALTQEDKKEIKTMLNEINTLYNKNFEVEEYIPDREEDIQNVLLAKNNEGERVIVMNTLDKKDEFYNSYKDYLAGSYAEKLFAPYKHFNGDFRVHLFNLTVARFGVDEIESNIEDILKSTTSLTVFTFFEGEVTEADKKGLYDFYLETRKYNENFVTFEVAENVDKEKTNKFIDYYTYYRNQTDWEYFDESITRTFYVPYTEEITYEMFVELFETATVERES